MCHCAGIRMIAWGAIEITSDLLPMCRYLCVCVFMGVRVRVFMCVYLCVLVVYLSMPCNSSDALLSLSAGNLYLLAKLNFKERSGDSPLLYVGEPFLATGSTSINS
jgi:hypothetical protein